MAPTPAIAASPARSLYRAILRALQPLARSGADLPLRAPLDADTAWGQHRLAPSGAAAEREALAALLPGGAAALRVPPDALFPPATVPPDSGASPDFVPQRRYRAADLRRLAAANFRAPLLQQQQQPPQEQQPNDDDDDDADAESPGAAAAAAAQPPLLPRLAQALAALRALPEQLVLERGSSACWHEGVLVEATARFMHATPAAPAPAQAFASRGSGGSGRGPAIGGGHVPLALPPHVQQAAARLLGVALPGSSGGGSGGSSGNEADDGEDEEETDEEDEDEAQQQGSEGSAERRGRLERRRAARRRLALGRAAAAADADAARQHVFTYRVRVTNARAAAAAAAPAAPHPRIQILGREWSIWDGDGDLKGLVPLSTANAVVGQQPVLPFGACFEYCSGTPLEAPKRPGAAGSMRGRLALAVREDTAAAAAAAAAGGGGGGGRGAGGMITATPLVVPIAEFRLVAPSSDPREEEEEEEEGPVEEEEGGGTRRRGRWAWLASA
jgi:uncharacterized protein affecting Mg2+/Co2+ transport